MRSLWRRMTEIYGQRWTSAYGEDAGKGAGDTWSRGLADIAPEQLGLALKACVTRADPWPPTLPEFRALCFGIPSVSDVRLQLAGVAEVSPFTRAVHLRLDAWRYHRAPTAEADRMLAEAYNATREAVLRGEPLPQPSPALEAPKPQKPKPADPENVNRQLALMRELLRVTPSPPETPECSSSP